MKTIKVTRGQYQILQKYPNILSESKDLLRTCKKVITKVEAMPEYASKHKRQTAYKRIITLCQKAVDSVEK